MNNQEFTPEQILEAVENLSDTERRDAIFARLDASNGNVSDDLAAEIQAAFMAEAEYQDQIVKDADEDIAVLDESMEDERNETDEMFSELEHDKKDIENDLDKMEESGQDQEESDHLAELQKKLNQ